MFTFMHSIEKEIIDIGKTHEPIYFAQRTKATMLQLMIKLWNRASRLMESCLYFKIPANYSVIKELIFDLSLDRNIRVLLTETNYGEV